MISIELVSSQPVGYLFRYYADPDDPYLCDDGTLADPDFFSNKTPEGIVPTWVICGVYHRRKLKVGDAIFFIPVKQRLAKAGIPFYICTGILHVGKILEDSTELQSERILQSQFKRLYRIELRKHLKEDKPRTGQLRGQRIILGDPKESIWFGRNSLNTIDAFGKLGMDGLSSAFPHRSNRGIRPLSEREVAHLDNYLRTKLLRVVDPLHHHLQRRLASTTCQTCHGA